MKIEARINNGTPVVSSMSYAEIKDRPGVYKTLGGDESRVVVFKPFGATECVRLWVGSYPGCADSIQLCAESPWVRYTRCNDDVVLTFKGGAE